MINIQNNINGFEMNVRAALEKLLHGSKNKGIYYSKIVV